MKLVVYLLIKAHKKRLDPESVREAEIRDRVQ